MRFGYDWDSDSERRVTGNWHVDNEFPATSTQVLCAKYEGSVGPNPVSTDASTKYCPSENGELVVYTSAPKFDRRLAMPGAMFNPPVGGPKLNDP